MESVFQPQKIQGYDFFKQTSFKLPPIIFNNTQVLRVTSHKHLGIYLTCNLDWTLQISQICLKANRKLAVLRSVKYLQRKTLNMLYKVIVRSIIDYGLPLYFNNLKQTDIAKLNRIQYNAAKVVSGALPYTSREKLEQELGWESLQNRANYLGITLFHKIHLHETRPLIRNCMPPVLPFIDYNLRSNRNNGGYEPFSFHSVSFSK